MKDNTVDLQRREQLLDKLATVISWGFLLLFPAVFTQKSNKTEQKVEAYWS